MIRIRVECGAPCRILGLVLVVGAWLALVPGSPPGALEDSAREPETRQARARGTVPLAPEAGARGFAFAASGDIAGNARTAASLGALAREDVRFFLALGDFVYSNATPQQWCEFITGKLGSKFPWQLITGDKSLEMQRLEEFTACLPDRMGSVGGYGSQYYFDVNGLARVIAIAPGIPVGGVVHRYVRGSPYYQWLSGRIDEARGAGIRWIIVGMHTLCVSATGTSCTTGQDLTDLLIEKRVDLVLQANSHTYQRSKQVVCMPRKRFDPACVVDAESPYVKGKGTTFVIVGTFGAGLDNTNSGDYKANYFATMSGKARAHGFLRVDVTATALTGRFVRTGGGPLSDQFVITADGESMRVPVPELTSTASG